MDIQHDPVARAEKQLDRTLSFFARVESKASFLFGLNTGLLGIVALNFRASDLQAVVFLVPGLIFMLLIAASMCSLYRCFFPHLRGGTDSLIYFRSIAVLDAANFSSRFLQRSDADHGADLSEQIWRNSEILRTKYDALERGFRCSLVAMIPWLVYLGCAATLHPASVVLK